MEGSNIKNIIRTFFEKDASKRTQFLFRKWFRLDEHQAEKEEAMEELWERSPSVVSARTLEDLSKIKLQISAETQTKLVHPLFRRIVSYAAVIALIIATSVYFTFQFAVPAQPEYTQLSASYGESKKITLSDGSIVNVNAGSTLIYPKSFTANTRSVFLSGEANFKVAKDPSKPFFVKTKYLAVRALGTIFNVQSYPNEDRTTATLVDGSVKINMEQDKNKSFILRPNNQLTYSHHDNNITILNVDAAKIASWEDGYLIFQGVKFDKIAKTLERKYNIVINYEGGRFSQQLYYVKFNPKESLKQVLDVLCQLVDKSSYNINGATVYFHTK